MRMADPTPLAGTSHFIQDVANLPGAVSRALAAARDRAPAGVSLLRRAALRAALSMGLALPLASWAAEDPSYTELDERYFQDAARGLKETKAALAAAQAASNPATEMRATRNRLMALLQAGESNRADLVPLLQRGSELARAVGDEDARARFLILASQNDCPDEELPKCNEWIQEALVIARKQQDRRLQADALWLLGINAVIQGQSSRAIEVLRQAWTLYDDLGLPRRSADALYWAAGAYRARNQASQAELEQARQFLLTAEVELEATHAPSTSADVASALGDIDRRLNLPQEAEIAFRKALSTVERNGLSPLVGAVAKSRYAVLFLEQGRDAEAAAMLKDVLKNIDNFDASSGAMVYLRLARAQAHLGEHDNALMNLKQARALTAPLNLPKNEVDYHEAATDVYLALKKPEKAVEELRAQMRAERDAAHTAGEHELRRQQVQFDVALKDRENTLLKASASVAENRRLALVVALMSSLLLLGGGALLVVRLRRSKAASTDDAAKMHAIMEAAGDGLVTMDALGRIQSANVAACRIFGCAAGELANTSVSDLILADTDTDGDAAPPRPASIASLLDASTAELLGSSTIEALGRRKDGSTFPLEFSISSVPLSGQRLFVGVMRDITARKEAEEDLSRLAQHDSLTGLLNRAMFMNRLDAALVRARRSGRAMAIMFIDLDGFKRINDTAGHEAGDAVLVQTAQRLSATVRKSDTVARLAGDEFTVIVEDLEHGTADARAIAEKIVGAMRAPFVVGGQHQVVTISLGVLACEGGENTPPAGELLNQADQAMYRAKKSGKDAFEVVEATLVAE